MPAHLMQATQPSEIYSLPLHASPSLVSICPQVWYPFPTSHKLSHAFAFSVVVGFEAVMSFEAAVVFEAVEGFGVDDEVVASIVAKHLSHLSTTNERQF